MKIFFLSGILCAVLAINASPYTITNTSDLHVKVVLSESFKPKEERILKPGDVWVKDTSLLNCLDFVTVQAISQDGPPLSEIKHSIYAVCAGSGSLCIVRVPGENFVEIRTAWTGISAQACVRGY